MSASDLLWVAPLVFAALMAAWLVLLLALAALADALERPPWDR